MNVYDEDEQNFNFDFIMHENTFNHITDKSREARDRDEVRKSVIRPLTMRSRIKTKKGKKLILKKKREHERRRDRDSNEPRVYQCHHPICEKVFLDRNSYRKHLITHGEKQFVCQAECCGKKFLDNSKLKRHMLVHTGEKPYKCELCNKRFSLDFNLRTHLRIHTGEKPYVCSFESCYKRFSQSSNLSAHEKTHFLPKENESTSRKLSDDNEKKKRIFKVLRPNLHQEKPKPVIILDRHKYLDDLKKKEEDKKLEEQKRKETSDINNLNNNNELKNHNAQKSNFTNEITSSVSKMHAVSINENSTINNSSHNNCTNPSLNNTSYIIPNPKIDKIKVLIDSVMDESSKENEQLQEIKTMISLHTQKNEENSNHGNINESSDNSATQIEYSIPYYLTREWALKNLLKS